MTSKKVSESKTHASYIVMPEHTNHYGTCFGGTILSWIDMIGAMVAEKHSQEEVVTMYIDRITFKHSIRLGDHVHLTAEMKKVGKSSMTVSVSVQKHEPKSDEITLVISDVEVVFVALQLKYFNHNKEYTERLKVEVPKLIQGE